MFQPLDGPSAQAVLSITTGTVVEAKAGVSILSGRNVVMLQPLNDKLYVYFGDDTGVTPSVSTVQNNGFIIFKNAERCYEATDKQKIFILAVNSTTNVVVAERA